MTLYVASSWRNAYYPVVLKALRMAGVACYDWRDEQGFHWSEVFEAPHPAHVEHWTDPIPAADFKMALAHPRAVAGFERDMRHLREAEALLLVLPSGKSAHAEAGWAIGAGMPGAVFAPEALQPELMYGMFDGIFTDLVAAVDWSFDNTRGRIPA